MTKYFSQGNEEQIIADYFGDYVGTFLDIGANDCVTLSNTRRLALNSWAGICIEPNKHAYDRAVINCITLDDVFVHQLAITKTDKVCKLWCNHSHLDGNDIGLLSTTNDAELNRWPDTQFYEIPTLGLSFKTFQRNYGFETYDFISIDAEGMDYEILKQINLNGFKTKMICIEWNSLPEMKDKFDNYILPFGFKLIEQNAENVIYAK